MVVLHMITAARQVFTRQWKQTNKNPKLQLVIENEGDLYPCEINSGPAKQRRIQIMSLTYYGQRLYREKNWQ